jgi:hypothetical protein
LTSDQRAVCRNSLRAALAAAAQLGHSANDLQEERHGFIDARATPKSLITRYAKRMLIENALADAVSFFHIDALSSSVGMKVDFDMAGSHARQIEAGSARSRSRRTAPRRPAAKGGQIVANKKTEMLATRPPAMEAS